MQEELLQFERNKVWRLVPCPKDRHIIETRWVFRNKLDDSGLKQAPRAWYDRLATFLLQNGYRRGVIDRTLFILEEEGMILVVQVYVDDIIFGSTNLSLVEKFKDLMSSEFEMSMIGELSFFLGLQITQREDGIQIHQQKYLKELLKRFKMEDCKSMALLVQPVRS